ncbi:alpha/beta hydrolase [Nocardioides aestuarii]|uniref:Alpha/beta hydrolase n=1 Tax=Nocardioides aestuarii TaxID=252231 RepID=A0ABW4TI98_9ACTN
MADFTDDELAGILADRASGRAEGAAEATVDVARVEDVAAGGVPSRLYVPEGARDAILYLHGGGFVLGDLVSHDGFARRLAAATGWAVLMPAYRLAPEHPWPAAAHDARSASDWLEQQSFDRLVVAGDSAGSALAIGEALRVPERWVGQVQVYPFVDPGGATYDRELTGIDLTVERCDLFWRMYLQGGDGDEALHVLAGSDLAGQPPALVHLAEIDVLTPTGHAYAARLREAGVPVDVSVFPGVLHGFWRKTDNDQAAPALDDLSAWLDRR